MHDGTEPASLADDAEALAREIRRHARVLSGPRDIEEIIAAINGVRTAARRYVESVFAQTGWVNVFANLETTGAETEDDAPVPDDDRPVVSYRSRYRLRTSPSTATKDLSASLSTRSGTSASASMPPQTASAEAMRQVPAKTARRRNSAFSPVSRRS